MVGGEQREVLPRRCPRPDTPVLVVLVCQRVYSPLVALAYGVHWQYLIRQPHKFVRSPSTEVRSSGDLRLISSSLSLREEDLVVGPAADSSLVFSVRRTRASRERCGRGVRATGLPRFLLVTARPRSDQGVPLSGLTLMLERMQRRRRPNQGGQAWPAEQSAAPGRDLRPCDAPVHWSHAGTGGYGDVGSRCACQQTRSDRGEYRTRRPGSHSDRTAGRGSTRSVGGCSGRDDGFVVGSAAWERFVNPDDGKHASP